MFYGLVVWLGQLLLRVYCFLGVIKLCIYSNYICVIVTLPRAVDDAIIYIVLM